VATTPFSARFDSDLLERLRRLARRQGLSASELAERFVEEGVRGSELPGVVFRSGPAGRRAGVLGGPDVWEIVRDVERARAAGVVDPLGHVVATTDLGEEQVRLALAYHAAYPDEIDARIADEEELIARLDDAGV
jgi:hypothetical protein